MKIEDGYLSDEELEQLILEVEEHELVSAPPGFMEEVLRKTEAQQIMPNVTRESTMLESADLESAKQENVKQKSIGLESTKQECVKQTCIKQENTEQEIRKETKVIEFQKYCIRVITSAAAAIAILFALPNTEPVEIPQIPTRQELVGTCVTREEVLDNTGFFTKFMNGLNHRIGGFSNEAEKEE